MGTLILLRNGREMVVRETTREIINQGLYNDKVIVTRYNLGSLDHFEIEWNSIKKLIGL